MKWSSQKMVWTIFHIRFDNSTAEQAEQHKYPTVGPQPTMAPYCTRNHDDNNAFHLTPVRLRHEALTRR